MELRAALSEPKLQRGSCSVDTGNPCALSKDFEGRAESRKWSIVILDYQKRGSLRSTAVIRDS